MFPTPNFILAFGTLRLEYFSPWVALGLFAALGGITVLLGIKSLAGLGPVRKWVAIGTRLAVIALFILILGNVKWIRKNTDVEVMVVRDISRSTELVTDFPGEHLQSTLDNYLSAASKNDKTGSHTPADKIGQISFNEHPYIDAIPSGNLTLDSRAIRDAGTGTDAAAAIQLALASMSSDTMHRLLLVWDGNATAGDLNTALAAAASEHVPIDVMPLKYNITHEVMMDKFIAPTLRQEGQAFTIEVHLKSTNTQNVEGDLSVTDNGKLMAIKDGKTTDRVTLKPGNNVERIEVPPQPVGVHQFHATISNVSNVTASVGGDSVPAASQLDNKSADIFTFVKGKGQVLFVDNTDPDGHTDISSSKYLLPALADEHINVVRITPDQFPNNPVELQQYDAIILGNVPRGNEGLSDDQDKMVASYVHDFGGGLVMIGGPQSFGAGGWQGSKIEAELPVTMEVPAQRQIPKGALVLIMDPAEAPSGNYWGEQCAIKAMEALSSQDDIGIIDFAWSNQPGSRWDYPLAPKGDGSKVIAALKGWELGDMPSFEDSINLALDGGAGHPGLIASDARQKHIVIITDDDPQMPSEATIQRCIANHISVSSITVYPHQSGNVAPGIIDLAKRTNGKNYGPIEGNFNQLPQIFIKEATVVKRTIIHEDEKGIPVTLNNTSSELMKGITPGAMPPLYGMDLTGRRDNPLIEVPITAGEKNDPVLAHWQAGLGKSAAYTGSADNRWDGNWISTPMYEKFWSQVVRGVSRAAGSSDFEEDITTDGDKGHIVVQAEKEGNAFNNFLTIMGTISGPDLVPHPVRLVQTGPGVYEGDFDASQQGGYISYLQFAGDNGQNGVLPVSGTVVNGSAELRDLQSNDTLLKEIADRTGGRVLAPFDASDADLFRRDGLEISSSPKSIWDILVPILLGLILLDVAIRRIAWDWTATKRFFAGGADYVREFTTTVRKVENRQTLESLKRVRDEVAEQKFKPGEQKPGTPGAPRTTAGGAPPPPIPGFGSEPRPDPKAKFDAGGGVEGDITSVVGGATDKPLPSAPKKIEPKGTIGAGQHTGGLLEAKRRAQQKIKQQEEGN
jgi:uncharacterized membrane protein